jgi:2-methylcitrate synthase
MADKKTGEAGMRGQAVGRTAISSVKPDDTTLTYHGYDVGDLVEQCEFEEVAWLLFTGELPDRSQLMGFRSRLNSLRDLPQPLKEVLERIPARAHPMDVIRTGVSFLGSLCPETEFSQQRDAAERVLAAVPGIILYWYRYSRDGVQVDLDTGANSLAAHFLQLLHGRAPAELDARALNASLILYAEHEFNTSTFTARVCASTLSDIFSCFTAAMATLRGALHGGANEAAMDMIAQWSSPDEAEQGLLRMLARKEKIMGFGHAVYRVIDPRNAIIKSWSGKLAAAHADDVVYPVAERCEEVMWREKKLICNTDFYHASAYHFLGIPTKLFTPIFLMARISGWSAHIFEQRADNRIIRPDAEYVGPEPRAVTALDER